MRALTSIAVIFCGAALSAPLRAEDTREYSHHSSAKAVRQSAEEIEDIGEVRSDKGASLARSKFRFGITAREQFTTNAKLSGNHSSGDFLFLPTIDIGYKTELGQHFSFDIAGKIETVLYGRYDERSFYGYSAVATLDYRPAAHLPRIYVGAEPYRYVSYDTGSRITQAIGLAVGTDWGKSFNQGRTLVYAGYTFTTYFADPGIDDRTQHSVVLGLAHAFAERLTGQLYYAWQYSDFEIDRSDSRHILGGNLIYQFADRWFGSVTTSFVDTDSTQADSSYQSFGASLGVTKQF